MRLVLRSPKAPLVLPARARSPCRVLALPELAVPELPPVPQREPGWRVQLVLLVELVELVPSPARLEPLAPCSRLMS